MPSPVTASTPLLNQSNQHAQRPVNNKVLSPEVVINGVNHGRFSYVRHGKDNIRTCCDDRVDLNNSKEVVVSLDHLAKNAVKASNNRYARFIFSRDLLSKKSPANYHNASCVKSLSNELRIPLSSARVAYHLMKQVDGENINVDQFILRSRRLLNDLKTHEPLAFDSYTFNQLDKEEKRINIHWSELLATIPLERRTLFADNITQLVDCGSDPSSNGHIHLNGIKRTLTSIPPVDIEGFLDHAMRLCKDIEVSAAYDSPFPIQEETDLKANTIDVILEALSTVPLEFRKEFTLLCEKRCGTINDDRKADIIKSLMNVQLNELC